MSMNKTSVNRSVDPDGDQILVFEDAQQRKAQSVVIVDGDGNLTGEFATNDMATVGLVTYVGKEKSDQTWMIVKIDETTGMAIRYATQTNNALITTYTNAWASKETLVYDVYAAAL